MRVKEPIPVTVLTGFLGAGKTTLLRHLLTELGPNIYRSKGILHIKGQPKRVVFQAVHMMFDAEPDRCWRPGEPRETCLVFIGRDLDRARIRQGFEACLAEG